MSESWLNLEGKTVIVTGGASGIGKAVAQGFLNAGSNVVISDMAPEAPEMDEAAGKLLYVKTDVTKVADVTTLEEAEIPNAPSSPNIRRNTLIGFLAGGVLISVVILVVEVLDDRVKKPEDVEEALGITLLGVVPNMNKL